LFFVSLSFYITNSYADETNSVQQKLNTFLCSTFGKEESEQILAKPLTDGWSSAKLFHLKQAEKHYVVRFQNLENSSRLKECDMLMKASQAKIAPHVYLVNQEEGVILMDYINDGTTITYDHARQSDILRNLAQAVRTIHTLPKTPYPVNRLLDKVRDHYAGLNRFDLVTEEMRSRMSTFEQLHTQLDNFHYPQTMIHGDLHVKNIFLTRENAILFIDWEGARYDDPFFDLAYSACVLNLNNEQEKKYLADYLDHSFSNVEWEHYQLCKNITALGIYFQLLEFAYSSNENKPFNEIKEPIKPWGWYLEHFAEHTQKPHAELIYNWAHSALKLLSLS
jgi:thiamine kinase-like enzyme